MRHPLDVSSRIALSCIVLLALAGCGGGSSASAPPAGDDPPPPPVQAEIQGVATPSSVAVVTATNAQ